MNLETKITIYKFTPQLFTLTPTFTGQFGGVRFRPKKSTELGCFALIDTILRSHTSGFGT